MHDWWAEWQNKYAVVVLGAVIGYVGYHSIHWSDVDGQTWAAWVQAIGSIAALGAVAWTVQTQERYRQSEATAKAVIVAAAQTMHLATVSGEITVVQARFDQAKHVDCAPALFGELLLQLEAIPSWSSEELGCLAPLPNKIAFKVAGGIDRLSSAIVALRHICGRPELQSSAEYRRDKAAFLSFCLNESALLFNTASSRMQLITLGQTGPYS